jgi:dTDP-4-dehydrorhamnose reductase
MSMKVLLTGADGQTGQTLIRSALVDRCELVALSRADLDITDARAVLQLIAALKPDVIINAAAYTAVDAAESNADVAFAVNATGPENLARGAQIHGSHLIHLSTDFIFDGSKNLPYTPADSTGPLGVYGHSKLAGEQAVRRLLPEHSTIIRTAWLYSQYRSNFVKTMLRLMREKEQIRVVDDQIGTPCSTLTLSACINAAVEKRISGIFHWSDAGLASWYDFAVAIQEEALLLGLLENAIPIKPIPCSAYPTPARRPVYSVLDKRETAAALNLEPQHWRSALRGVLKNF